MGLFITCLYYLIKFVTRAHFLGHRYGHTHALERLVHMAVVAMYVGSGHVKRTGCWAYNEQLVAHLKLTGFNIELANAKL